MTTTCNHALYAIIDVFTQYFDIMSPILIEELYTQLKWCVKQDNEQLARSATNCFENFVISNGTKFNQTMWAKTCEAIGEIFKSTIPNGIMTWRPDSNDFFSTNKVYESFNDSFHEESNYQTPHSNRKTNRADSVNSLNSSYSDDFSSSKSKIPHQKVPDMEHKVFQTLLIKCVVQLELIQTVDNIVFFPTMSKKEDAKYVAAAQALSSPSGNAGFNFLNEQPHDNQGMYAYLNNEQLFALIECLYGTYEFSRKFNANGEQRNVLWKAGFKGKDKPNLLKHETMSLACIFRILFKMLSDPGRENCYAQTQERLLKVCHEALQYYLLLPSETHRESWDNIMLLLLSKILKLDPPKFKKFSSALYRDLCDTLTFNLKIELRNVLREFFIKTGSVFELAENSK